MLVVADDEKAIQNTKRERWDGEKVHRSNGLTMVSEEHQPSLHRVWISRGSPDPSRDTPFREIESHLEQFAVNTRCSPGRILGNHAEDQGANLFADTLPSSCLSDSGDPRPIQTKSRSMPVYDVLGVTKTRGCLHPDEHILNATQNSLCRAVNRRRGRCACRASNCRRRARFSRTRSARQLKELTNQPRKCWSDKIMAKNFSGKDRIKPCAKSFISQVYDLLARHSADARHRRAGRRLWPLRLPSGHGAVARQELAGGYSHSKA